MCRMAPPGSFVAGDQVAAILGRPKSGHELPAVHVHGLPGHEIGIRRGKKEGRTDEIGWFLVPLQRPGSTLLCKDSRREVFPHGGGRASAPASGRSQ